ncbi:cilia- and flagella-associated protein 43-like [Physella acuta]|uniref:cilia- and flagella-associated protein 43-like n=1 Tax=Physella acuta TaxID=109671 RepID=UPI0027DC21BF|nr:cilia- and flagella-associated protein 43-like [Physella acuta]
MDTGVLNLAWCQGYNGSPLSFIEPNVLCYQCGRNFKTISTDGKQSSFAFKGTAIGPMAVHKINKHIAVGEYGENPNIYVYAYPTYTEISVLQDGADLEFQQLVFSEGDHLISVSAVPNFTLILWNYLTGTKLTSYDVSPEPIYSLSFNKTNWRQICMINPNSITLWNIEQCGTKYLMIPRKISLPPIDVEKLDDEFSHVEKSSVGGVSFQFSLPESTVAGLTGTSAERIHEFKDITLRVKPLSMTWMPTGDFYVGCEGGQLLKVDSDQTKAKIMNFSSHTRASVAAKDMSQTKSVKYEEHGALDFIALHNLGLYTAGRDGTIKLFEIHKDELFLLDVIETGSPLTSLQFNQTYQNLAWGSVEGLIQVMNCGDLSSVVTIASLHQGNIVGVGGLSVGSDCCVCLRQDGYVQVWKTSDGTFMGEVATNEPGSTLACCPIAHYAAVGTESGNVYIVDLTKPTNPRVILNQRLFKSPITRLVFNGDDGKILFAAAECNHIFVIDARPSSNFAILGYINVVGVVKDIAAHYQGKEKTVLVASCNNNPEINGANLLLKFTFSSSMIDDITEYYNSPMCDIKEEACQTLKMGLRHAICGLAIGEGEAIYALSASTRKLLCYTMPVQDPEKTLKKIDLLLSPVTEFPGHMLSGGNVLLSPHLKWLLSYSPDGCVKIRSIASLERTAIFTPHEYRSGGIKAVALSDDCQYVLTCGYDGVISCYHWNHLKSKGTSTSVYKQKRSRDLDLMSRENQILSEATESVQPIPNNRRESEVERDRRELIEQAKQAAQDRDEIYVSPPPTPRINATWLEQRKIDALRKDNHHFASIKHDLRSQIRDIRRTIQKMMAQNKDLPEIEKLGRHEFDLDLEEQNRLQLEGEAEVQKVRESIEFDNLAKLYLRDKIKEECWDKMLVKGRSLQAFNSQLEVSNFPLRERPQELIRQIETVSVRRKIELRELQARNLIAEFAPKFIIHEEEATEGEEDDAKKEHPSISGSLGSQYGGGNELFYSQFELHTREQKITQIILLEDAIHRIKEAFNKEFDEVYSKKEQEISKYKEKNKRIAKIIKDLNLDEEVTDPNMSVVEKPELLLEVLDSEIKVERYLTPEQRKRMEEERLLEEERLARERGDNARERALEMMMGGVLEIKKEDELKKDVPKPPFMLTKKEDEYSEEEQKLYKEYLKKVQDLNEEREKFRKQLEAELKKLQATIQENLQAFDDVLYGLFMRKIKVMMVVYQEELKILRLRFTMLVQEELNTKEKDLLENLEHKKHLKQISFEALAETRKNMEQFRNDYEHLQAEDKYLDKSFRREFTDLSGLNVDLLYKQFKRRPRTQKYKAVDAAKSLNPFIDRPSSAMQLNHLKSQLAHGLDELDKNSNLPDGIESSAWDKMCRLRRAKVESELQLKIKANILAEMNLFLQKRQDEDDKLKVDIENLNHSLSRMKEDEQRFILNLEVQLLLKQGQIEVDASSFIRDFRNSVLVHRNVVEDLNTTIKQLGERKIASMVESKDFRKGIIQLEWEHKKMSMQMEDLENKMKDIQFIKVTREIQAYLQEEDYETKKAEEISKLEMTLIQLKKFHEKTIEQKKLLLKELTRNTKVKQKNNKKLDAELLDLNVVVNERKQIEDINVENRDDDATYRRYNEIVQRRKLVDLAKAQAQEVAVLRAEVERLRMRTFPALVQVEH